MTVPIWQAIALVMTSPFFIIIGARLFLGETVGRDRWLATLTGFIGAMIILQPWSDSFTMAALLPVLSALLWGGSSLIMKNLTHHEPPETVTVWLLVLLTPINAGLAAASGFAVPEGLALWLLLAAGLLTALGQYLLTLAYNAADAAYVQPFDDLKLPLNVLAGWLVFGYAPSGYLWLGATLILVASLFLMLREAARKRWSSRDGKCNHTGRATPGAMAKRLRHRPENRNRCSEKHDAQSQSVRRVLCAPHRTHVAPSGFQASKVLFSDGIRRGEGTHRT